MVRYSQDHNHHIYGIEEEDPSIFLPSPNNALNEQAFGFVLNLLLETLRDRATSGDSRKKYAAGHAVAPGYETIYALAQCTPDIDKANCNYCLNGRISAAVPLYCSGKSGARVLKPSCNIRFEFDLFYNSTADSEVNIPAPAPAPVTLTTPVLLPKQGKKSNRKRNIIIILVVIAFVTMLLGGICIFFRVKKPRVKLDDDIFGEISLVESLQYNFEDIRSATGDFSDENKLGQGGFGVVYKHIYTSLIKQHSYI